MCFVMLCEVLSPLMNHYKCFKVKTFTNIVQKFKRELSDTMSEACWPKFKPFANKGTSVILATKTAQCVHVECFDDTCNCIFKGQTINSLKMYKNVCFDEMFTCFVSLGMRSSIKSLTSKIHSEVTKKHNQIFSIDKYCSSWTIVFYNNIDI